MHPFETQEAREHKSQIKEMASMKLLTLTCILLISGLVVFGGEMKLAAAACEIQCIQGGYITCDNYPGKELDGCVCECAPKDGKNCVLHLDHGPSSKCAPLEPSRLD